jgi:uncharacterized protein YukE
MTEVSYETEQLQKLASRLKDLTTETGLEVTLGNLKVMPIVWPLLFMGETRTQYDSLCESVEKATKAVLSMTGTLADSLEKIAAEYEKQEADAGTDIERLAD